ncbi:hypothetical protein VNI00_013912 [Paramarasmius palmivorus]|uniref:AB hydrolase-1 domain-containing protein n=1 Tax=Paramarasmius palmivorus TaxID=297713 RepID=A0AAW0BX73_9AGAR
MPFVNVETQTGNVRYHYTISTPASNNASFLQPNLPTILFVHCVFATQMVFHSQFADPHLRRFNLVTFDIREHGGTKGERIPEKYDQSDTADDTLRFMNAISLPPCHICALGSGTTMALELAIRYPERVLTLTLLSQLCLEAPPDVSEGFKEVFLRWMSAHPNAETVNEEFLEEAELGLAQYAFTDLTHVSKLGINNPFHLQRYQPTIMASRRSHTVSELSRLTCPVLLIDGGNGVAYPPDYTERLQKQFEEAGVEVSSYTVPNAPHFLCVDYGDVVNPLIYDLVMSKSNGPLYSALNGISDGCQFTLVLRTATSRMERSWWWL